jgi:hypothetical protein
LAATVAAATATVWRTTSGFLFTNALHHFTTCGFAGSSHDITRWWLANAAPQHLSAHGDWLGFFTLCWTKTVNNFDFNALVDETLYILHEAFFVHTDQTDRFAASASTARTADAVHIVFADVGNFKVHNMR